MKTAINALIFVVAYMVTFDCMQDDYISSDYVREHQYICEAAGFKSHFTLRSYLRPLFQSI
jgi:hypothetical protein